MVENVCKGKIVNGYIRNESIITQVILIGNKRDLCESNISTSIEYIDEVYKLCNDKGLLFIDVSAKDDNSDDLFSNIIYTPFLEHIKLHPETINNCAENNPITEVGKYSSNNNKKSSKVDCGDCNVM